MRGKTCGVQIYKGPCDCKISCERCRIGCYRLARFKNPFFGSQSWSEDYWWRNCCYRYAEYLCAECYDGMVSIVREMEDGHREDDPNYKEDSEFTAILKTL